MAAPAAAAEDAEMELQRCIWRCLANSKGNTDPAYHACVVKHCTEEDVATREGAGTLPPWRAVADTEMGHGPTAYVRGRERSRIGELGLFCGRRGPVLYLADIPGEPRLPLTVRIDVDGRSFVVRLDHKSGMELMGRAAGGLVQALTAGTEARVRVQGVEEPFSLAGSRRALSRSLSSCL
jgi:hypothetical protein